MSDLDLLDARQVVQPVRARLTIWHARAAFLAVVARQPKRPSPAGEALADQCAKLIVEITRQREQLSLDAKAAGIADHRLVGSTLDELSLLLAKLGESLDGLRTGARTESEVRASPIEGV